MLRVIYVGVGKAQVGAAEISSVLHVDVEFISAIRGYTWAAILGGYSYAVVFGSADVISGAKFGVSANKKKIPGWVYVLVNSVTDLGALRWYAHLEASLPRKHIGRIGGNDDILLLIYVVPVAPKLGCRTVALEIVGKNDVGVGLDT